MILDNYSLIVCCDWLDRADVLGELPTFSLFGTVGGFRSEFT